jgi:hypothetical protein
MLLKAAAKAFCLVSLLPLTVTVVVILSFIN